MEERLARVKVEVIQMVAAAETEMAARVIQSQRRVAPCELWFMGGLYPWDLLGTRRMSCVGVLMKQLGGGELMAGDGCWGLSWREALARVGWL